MLTVFVACRAVFKLQFMDLTDPIHFNDPTTVAMGSLIAIAPYDGALLDSLLKGGGLAAIVKLLSTSGAGMAMRMSAHFIDGLMAHVGLPNTCRRREIADELDMAGAWPNLPICRAHQKPPRLFSDLPQPCHSCTSHP
jgi:hypothetical protein